MAAELDAAPESIVFFDDSPVSCRGAKTAGMRVVACRDPLFAAHEAELRTMCDSYVERLDDLSL